jgi:hypothetical protein
MNKKNFPLVKKSCYFAELKKIFKTDSLILRLPRQSAVDVD